MPVNIRHLFFEGIFHMKIKEIFGENLLKSCFSFEGTISRLGFIGFFWLLALINGACSNIAALVLSVIIFYATLTVTQKRCRDFNYDGTIFILIYSLYYLILICWLYMRPYNEQVKDILRQHKYIAYFFDFVFVIYVLSIILLFVIPGKKEKNLTLRSPLLKHPWFYIGVCFIIYSVCLSALIYWHTNSY